MLTVHHLQVSQSDRIVWLCEELEIPYRLELYAREPEDGRAPPQYRDLHPFGLAPVITDGDLALGESGAIIEYIIDRYGDGRLKIPANRPHFAEYLYWYHFANATLQPSAIIEFVLQTTGVQNDPKLIALRERLPRCYALADQRLGETEYFAGSEFTAADIMMVFNLTTLRLLSNSSDLAPYPHIRAYLTRINDRPAFQRALQKADPDLGGLNS